MKKYIKWVFLILLMICIIITVILFVDFVNRRKDLNIEPQENKIKLLYNKDWIRYGAKLYMDGVEVFSQSNILDDRYMIFTENEVTYCNQVPNKCKVYSYVYDEQNETIFFDSEDYFVKKGTYKITYYQDSFDLTLEEDNNIIVYHFKQIYG